MGRPVALPGAACRRDRRDGVRHGPITPGSRGSGGAGRLSNRGISIALLTLFLALPGSGCRFVSTQLSRINAAPAKYQGLEVTVAGRVEAVRWIPETGVTGFRLVDGADSLLVLTPGDAPPPGQRARLVGEVSRRFPVEGRNRVVLLYNMGNGAKESPAATDAR